MARRQTKEQREAKRIKKNGHLNPKEELFCREYVVDSNGTNAAIRAGYSENGAGVLACRKLKKTKIKKRIMELRDRTHDRIEVNAMWVLDKLVENVQRAMQTQPVLDKEGQPTGEYTYNGHVANKALELLGKHFKMFTEKFEGTLAVGTLKDFLVQSAEGRNEYANRYGADFREALNEAFK